MGFNVGIYKNVLYPCKVSCKVYLMLNNKRKKKQMKTKRKTIEFTISNLFWTPENEKEYKSFVERYAGNEKALVALGGQIAMNYILNKINKEFDVYKKENK